MSEATSFVEQAPSSPESAAVAARFPDVHPPFDPLAATVESNRCLFCFDAPCAHACPTHIDVPRFIKKIATGNLEGSARTILDANILGESCARACPVDVLCEGACVLHRYNRQPIAIGRLQRYAMDHGAPSLPFIPAPETGKRVALIGAGPASLACAAELRRHGVAATLFDARPLPGGLNTYGIAEYKLPLKASLREIDRIAALGVVFRCGVSVDREMVATLDAEYDAIFLGIGLGAIHRLGLAHEDVPGVTDALTFIAAYKAGRDPLPDAAKRVVVIGAGNTAIDAAIAAVRLGAEEVTMVYRRGAEQMSAFAFEFDHAKQEGVRFLWHRQPVEWITGALWHRHVEGVKLQRLEASKDGSLIPVADDVLTLAADVVILSIGQGTHSDFLEGTIALERGRIVVDAATGQTSHPRYFAGGDCTNGGREVVDAVADGRRAGSAMAAFLMEANTHA